MNINIDLTDRLYSAFGFVPKYKPEQNQIRSEIEHQALKSAALNAGIGRANIALIKKVIGSNIYVNDRNFADLTLRSTIDGQTYSFANSPISEGGNIIATPPILSFQRSKTIKTTVVDGSDAVVVESFGVAQWSITMDGILVDMENHHYPQSQLRQLHELFEVNALFDVIDCELMEDLNIESLYIESLGSIQVLPEYQDTVKYQLRAKSFKPIEFFL